MRLRARRQPDGTWLERELLRRAWTYQDLARHADISRVTISFLLHPGEYGRAKGSPAKCVQVTLTLLTKTDAAYVERVHGYHQTRDYQQTYEKRKMWVEPLFGEAQEWHGMRMKPFYPRAKAPGLYGLFL